MTSFNGAFSFSRICIRLTGISNSDDTIQSRNGDTETCKLLALRFPLNDEWRFVLIGWLKSFTSSALPCAYCDLKKKESTSAFKIDLWEHDLIIQDVPKVGILYTIYYIPTFGPTCINRLFLWSIDIKKSVTVIFLYNPSRMNFYKLAILVYLGLCITLCCGAQQ